MMRNIIKIIILTIGLCLLGGCAKQNSNVAASPEEAITFTDDLGYTVAVDHPQKTAVLSGSYADAWQLAGGVIAAATEDAEDFLQNPDKAVSLGKINSPNIETMIAEKVDFAILSGAMAEQVKLRDTLEAAGITTAYFKVETFEDYAEMMKILTDITGNKELYQMNVEDIRDGIAAQIARADGSNPTVLFLRAYSTGVKVQGSDTMTGQMLKELGCVNIADSEETLLKELNMEAILAADPDYIFVTTMGESQEAALKMVDELLVLNPAWSGLTAVKEGRYHVLPKELFHLKPNKRWGESYQILADYLYGEK